MLFINTRPENRAKPLTMALLDQGINVIELPLLELVERPFTEDLKHLYRQLPHTQIIVVVSPTAVDVGMKYLQQCGIVLSDLSDIIWVAVGEKTAESLSSYGIKSVRPEVETSEGILHLPTLNELPESSKIAFWRGEGGRQFMMQTLAEQGQCILNFVLYERQCPEKSKFSIETIQHQLQQASSYIMVISSEASWWYWVDLIKHNIDMLNKADYWVLGERLFELLLNYQKQNNLSFKITKLANLKIDLIMQHVFVAQGKK